LVVFDNSEIRKGGKYLKECLAKTKSVIIYSPSCCSIPVCCYFSHGK